MAKFCKVCGGNIAEGGCSCAPMPAKETVSETSTPVVEPAATQTVVVAPQIVNNYDDEEMEFKDQIKAVFERGVKIFKDPEEALVENKDNSDIKSLLITLLLSIIVTVAMMYIFAEQAFGMIGFSVSDIETDQLIKFIIMIAGTCAIFFAVYGVTIFCIAKIGKKDADFMNVLVSSNINAFSVMATTILATIGLAIDEMVGIGVAAFGLFWFAGLTYQYLKTKFDFKTVELVYFNALVLITSIGLGGYLSMKLIEEMISGMLRSSWGGGW